MTRKELEKMKRSIPWGAKEIEDVKKVGDSHFHVTLGDQVFDVRLAPMCGPVYALSVALDMATSANPSRWLVGKRS